MIHFLGLRRRALAAVAATTALNALVVGVFCSVLFSAYLSTWLTYPPGVFRMWPDVVADPVPILNGAYLPPEVLLLMPWVVVASQAFVSVHWLQAMAAPLRTHRAVGAPASRLRRQVATVLVLATAVVAAPVVFVFQRGLAAADLAVQPYPAALLTALVLLALTTAVSAAVVLRRAVPA